MKFMYFFYPAWAASLGERKRRRPIARHTEPWQKMFAAVVELSRMAEDLGFEAVSFPEHHLHTEGGEMGSLPLLTQKEILPHYIVLLNHLCRTPFMLRLHPTGYAQHERAPKTVHPERSAAKSKGEHGIFPTHLI